MDEETYRFVRKPWIGGNGTMYFGIPPKIMKKLKLDHNQYLLVDVIEDILVIKKINQQFSKAEIKKIQTNNITLDKKDSIELIEDVEEENESSKEYNPLDEVF